MPSSASISNEIILARRPAYGPILVISRDGRAAIDITATAQAISRMCKQGDHVQWQRYPDLDPEAAWRTVRDQIGWIEARFGGRASTTNCQLPGFEAIIGLVRMEKSLTHSSPTWHNRRKHSLSGAKQCVDCSLLLFPVCLHVGCYRMRGRSSHTAKSLQIYFH